ncbi:MAG: helix-turn-helix domain-containing protein [Acidimicrobiales bacterium]|nr:helix-turn-helix domain-containing protein [Acidimicrobiales bacterium]
MSELEQRWRELGEFIREQRRIGHLSLRKLSEMAGISNPYLSQIERGLRKPSAEILQQIARSLQISAETLYVRAGILEERDTEFDLVAEIKRDPYLNEEQKKTLVHIYESFRAQQRARGQAEPREGNGRRPSREPAEDQRPQTTDDDRRDDPRAAGIVGGEGADGNRRGEVESAEESLA